jgi:hypothetical protein
MACMLLTVRFVVHYERGGSATLLPAPSDLFIVLFALLDVATAIGVRQYRHTALGAVFVANIALWPDVDNSVHDESF